GHYVKDKREAPSAIRFAMATSPQLRRPEKHCGTGYTRERCGYGAAQLRSFPPKNEEKSVDALRVIDVGSSLCQQTSKQVQGDEPLASSTRFQYFGFSPYWRKD
ncbi:hypothetical protein BIW11_10139, partial [Tropilaelaps mercedesae]